jgi:hypothetical protein
MSRHLPVVADGTGRLRANPTDKLLQSGEICGVYLIEEQEGAMAASLATYLLWLFMTVFMLGIVIFGGADKRVRRSAVPAKVRQGSRPPAPMGTLAVGK